MVVNEGIGTVQDMRAIAAARSLLSLREATILADVPEQRVRKDIETGVLTAPYVIRIDNHHLRTHWSFVFTLAAIYGNSCLNGKLRKRALNEVVKSRHLADEGMFVCPREGYNEKLYSSNYDRIASIFSTCHVSLDRFIVLDFSSVVRELTPRVGVYVKGLMRIEEKSLVLGGEAVFKGTRLPVVHIGKSYERGETLEHLLEDYPYLTESDIEFARMYYRAHPTIGRPPAVMEAWSESCASDA